MATTNRRHFTAQQKLAILDEARQSGTPISEVCRRHQIAPGQFYTWEKQARQAALIALHNSPRGRKKPDPAEQVHQEIQRLQAAVTELTLENLQLKKGCWP
jgi:transposase-like protein